MKKLIIAILAISLSASSFAQFKFKGVGAGLSLGSKAAWDISGQKMGLGLNINALAQITDKIDAEANFTYYFPSSYDLVFYKYSTNFMTINVNGRYNFYQESKITAYGLAGLNLSLLSAKVEAGGASVTNSDSKIGFNIGAGGAYEINSSLDATAQVGYTIVSDVDQLFINLGVMYKF